MRKRDIYLIIGLSILTAGVLYYGLVIFFIDPYLRQTFTILPALFSFYDTAPQEAVLLFGSSQVREAFNADHIEGEIGKEVFNLGYTGDIPLRRLTELDKIKRINPSIAVIGIIYFSVSNDTKIPQDHIALVADRINADTYTLSLLDESSKESLGMNFFEELLYKRKFLSSAIIHIFSKKLDDELQAVTGNFKTPFFYDKNQSIEQLKEKLERNQDVLNTYLIRPELNNNKKALMYLVQELKKGSKIVVVDMPIHPLLYSAITNESKKAYSSFVSKNIVPLADSYVNYQVEYNESYFLDLTHLNSPGKDDISKKLAVVLKDAIQ